VPVARIVARLAPSSTAVNTLNLPPPIPIHFHKSPDFPSGGRGITGLDFEVAVAGSVVRGTTGDDGRIDVRVPPGGSAKVTLLFGGAAVAEYDVTVEPNPLSDLNAGDATLDPGPKKVTPPAQEKTQAANEATNAVSIRGTQERLRMLGYQIGHGGPEGTGVSAVMTAEWERSVLDFQVDQGLLADAKVGPLTKGRLRSRAGG
jgi:hypothetical protein